MEKRSRLLLCSLHEDIRRWAEMLDRKLTELSELEEEYELKHSDLHRKDMQRIDSLRLEIKSEQEKYRKELSRQSMPTYEKIVDKYRIFTRKFTDLMRQADIIMSLDPMKSYLVDNIFARNIKFVNKVKKALGSTSHLSYKSLSPKKNYMSDTFNMKVHRQVTEKQINRMEPQLTNENWFNNNEQKNWLSNFLRLSNMSRPKNSKFRCGSASPTHYTTDNQEDVYQMGRDLQSVKSMMHRIARQVDTHQHEETQAKIALLKASYGRLNNKVQQLKQQNEELLEGIYQLSKDLRQEHRKYGKSQKTIK